jgi:MerR family transcriptional regulator, redox-sensitive transcriptional activator SoxR
LCNTVVNINSHTHDSDRIRAATTGRLPHRYGLVPYPGRVGDLAARYQQVNAEPHLKYGSGVDAQELLPGELASRAGVAISALHFYERQRLITSRRTSGNQRRYSRDTLRRVAFIKMSQRLGIPLARVRDALATLPAGRVPNSRDWARLSAGWRADLDDRIVHLQRLRDNLADCIGCGCLSLRACALFNPDDVLSAQGPGAVRL